MSRKKAEGDMVNSPAHYAFGAIECIDAIEAQMTREEFVGFLRGQVAKYVWRAPRKGSELQDYDKAAWYLDRLRATLKKEKPSGD